MRCFSSSRSWTIRYQKVCTDGWEPMNDISVEVHEVGKRKTQRIERKYLRLRTRIKVWHEKRFILNPSGCTTPLSGSSIVMSLVEPFALPSTGSYQIFQAAQSQKKGREAVAQKSRLWTARIWQFPKIRLNWDLAPDILLSYWLCKPSNKVLLSCSKEF